MRGSLKSPIRPRRGTTHEKLQLTVTGQFLILHFLQIKGRRLLQITQQYLQMESIAVFDYLILKLYNNFSSTNILWRNKL